MRPPWLNQLIRYHSKLRTRRLMALRDRETCMFRHALRYATAEYDSQTLQVGLLALTIASFMLAAKSP